MNAIIPASQTAVTPSEAIRDAWISMIERAAKDPAVDLAKLERMLTLRAQEHARQATQQYREAMSACQAAMEPIRTDAINTHANNAKYATLAAVDAVARPIYTAHGFALSFDTDECAKENHVRVVCRVHHAAGHAENFHIDMPCDGKGAKGNALMTTTHAVASAISYARRYLLSMVFSLCIEKDDDGNAAARHHEPAPARQPPRPTQGKHADGQDNRFYREPPHDPRTGEVIEDPAQEAEDEAANEAREAFLSTTRDRIRQARDWRHLGTWWNSDEQKRARRDFELSRQEVAGLVSFVTSKINALKNGVAA
jgi:hypothetical protein